MDKLNNYADDVNAESSPSYNKIILLVINYITPWSRVLLQKLTVTQLARNSLLFMELKSSLPSSQNLETNPYPEQDAPSSQLP
jgi:hypothetical protein